MVLPCERDPMDTGVPQNVKPRASGSPKGHSLRAMATVLGRVPSIVSRELARNAT
jgi:hypothetical protein